MRLNPVELNEKNVELSKENREMKLKLNRALAIVRNCTVILKEQHEETSTYKAAVTLMDEIDAADKTAKREEKRNR